MSYVRFSDDNHKSDVYAYESEAGYVTHVAKNRIIGDIPDGPDWTWATSGSGMPEGWAAESAKRHKAQRIALDAAERQDITHKYAGMTFRDSSLLDFLDRMELLRREGFHVPAHVFETIKSELDEVAA